MTRQQTRAKRRAAEYRKLRSRNGLPVFDRDGEFWPRRERRATARALAAAN